MRGETETENNLQDLIGYRFHNDRILEEAMTCRMGKQPVRERDCTEPLAAVGDAILDAVITEKLCRDLMHAAGDEIAAVPRPDDVKRSRTPAFAQKYQLSQYVKGAAEITREDCWRTGRKPDDQVTEILLGAVFVDAERHGGNGFEAVKKVLDGLGYF